MFKIEDSEVLYIREGRIKREERYDDFHYYDMRHDDNDWSEPITIEKAVGVNFFGTLVTNKPIAFIEQGNDIPLGEEPDENPELLDLIMENRNWRD